MERLHSLAHPASTREMGTETAAKRLHWLPGSPLWNPSAEALPPLIVMGGDWLACGRITQSGGIGDASCSRSYTGAWMGCGTPL